MTLRHQCFGKLAPGTGGGTQTRDVVAHEHEVDRYVYLQASSETEKNTLEKKSPQEKKNLEKNHKKKNFFFLKKKTIQQTFFFKKTL